MYLQYNVQFKQIKKIAIIYEKKRNAAAYVFMTMMVL